MAKSSIHIAPGQSGYFAHNSREAKTVNAIFKDEHNFISKSQKDCFSDFKYETDLRIKAYQDRTKQKIQSKTVLHLSAVVNLNQNHTETDLKKVCDYLEKTLDTKVIQYAIHRDEGHINDDGIQDKNYHAHIEFLGLDSNGGSVTRKMNKKFLMDLQTEVAQILKMERGHNYIKEKLKRPKRLDTYEFKKMKENEQKLRLVNKSEISSEVRDLKALIKELDGLKIDYNNARNLEKKLIEKLEKNGLEKNEMMEEIQNFKLELEQSKSKNMELEKQIEDLKEDKIYVVKNTTDTINMLNEDINKLEIEVTKAKNRASGSLGLNSNLNQKVTDLTKELEEIKKELTNARKTILTLKEENLSLKTELSRYKQDMPPKKIEEDYHEKFQRDYALDNAKRAQEIIKEKRELTPAEKVDRFEERIASRSEDRELGL